MILGIIQVRFSSKRFPGKALREINGRPLLSYLNERAHFSRYTDKVVISTADNEANLPIIKFARENGIDYFAGSEQDLVDRLYRTALKFGADAIVRLTGDCPLVDPRVIDKILRFYLDNADRYDYVSNTLKPTYPDGLDVEVIPTATLKKMWSEVADPFWREWLNSYIMENPEQYRAANLENDTDLSELRWTVDYEEDFIFVTNVFNRLYGWKKDFSMEDILALLRKEPQLCGINSMHARNEAYHKARKEACR